MSFKPEKREKQQNQNKSLLRIVRLNTSILTLLYMILLHKQMQLLNKRLCILDIYTVFTTPFPNKVSIEFGFCICSFLFLYVCLHLPVLKLLQLFCEQGYQQFWWLNKIKNFERRAEEYFEVFLIEPQLECSFIYSLAHSSFEDQVKIENCEVSQQHKITKNNKLEQRMQGGLFGLTLSQKIYLHSCQVMPTIIALMEQDLTVTMLLLQLFYFLSSWVYVKFMSIQKSLIPYKINELTKLKFQIKKGLVLGFSAFLLITIYGVVFIKIGKFVLPAHVNLGTRFQHDWWAFALLCLVNPVLQECFWRLFLPKTLNPNKYNFHLINISYLLLHFVLFSRYVGFFRAVPLVGTFFSVGRSMNHITKRYGIASSIVTHYGISLGGLGLYLYLKLTTQIFK